MTVLLGSTILHKYRDLEAGYENIAHEKFWQPHYRERMVKVNSKQLTMLLIKI